MPIQNMYMGAPNVSTAKRMRYDTLGYELSFYQRCLREMRY